MEKRLASLIPLKPHVELLDGGQTPIILEAVKASGILVYEQQ